MRRESTKERANSEREWVRRDKKENESVNVRKRMKERGKGREKESENIQVLRREWRQDRESSQGE